VGLVARHDLVDDTPFGSHGDSTSIMAVGNIDLWSGGRHRAAVRAARAEAEAARLEIERFADAVALEVENAYEQRLSAVERHATAVRAQQAAMEVERITAERFSQGVVKMIDVLDASTARRDSEMRELVARSDAHLALFRLAVRAGRRPEDVAPQTGLSLSSKNPRDEDR
jgi:outer membrane protein TolC